MNFHDFQIRAWRSDKSHIEVLVHSSPVGDMPKPVSVAAGKDLLNSSLRLFEDAAWYLKSDILDEVVKVGRQLSDIIVPRPVHTLLLASLERVPREDGLRLRLCLDDELTDLPWEFLYNPDPSHPDSLSGFFILNPRVSLVREAPTLSPGVETAVGEQRMVFAGAFQAGGGDTWGVLEEHRRLSEGLQVPSDALLIDFSSADEESISRMLQKPATIFHYAGHTDTDNGRGYLVKELRTEGPGLKLGDDIYVQPLYSETLGAMLANAQAKLAVFSACNSGRWTFVEPLLRAGVSAVIGTQGQVSVEAAITFCQKLYSYLAHGLSLDEAVTGARLNLVDVSSSSGANSFEWGTFMVYMPSPGMIVFPQAEDAPTLSLTEKAHYEREQIVSTVGQRIGSAHDISSSVDRAALRKGLMEYFSLEELDILCQDVKQDLADDGIELLVSLDIVGGEGAEGKALNLIRYLDRRGYLAYLVQRARKERPNIAI